MKTTETYMVESELKLADGTVIPQARVDEYRSLTGVRWPDSDIRDQLTPLATAAAALRDGHVVDFFVDMGSCQCGNFFASVQIVDGQVKKSGQFKRSYGMFQTVDSVVGLATDGQLSPSVYNATAAMTVRRLAAD